MIFLCYDRNLFLCDYNLLGGSFSVNRKIIGLTLLSLSVLTLTACGNRSDKSANKSDIKVAMVTNQGGVDDKSFNQSAWEGLQKVMALTISSHLMNQIMLITLIRQPLVAII